MQGIELRVQGMWFGVWGVEFGFVNEPLRQRLRCRVPGSGRGDSGSGIGYPGSGHWVSGSGIRVPGFGFRVLGLRGHR